ncbi:EamA family transporter [Mobiluncus curtisii]|uniref:Putative membrane protein n=1 Tax=Mobiluncus curtisii ATCC 51333 TaxID=887326 RepID=E6LXG2_9ACTO|nr:EamA family transporter [Mobiluncus curtisii]EFU80716.1 putative membrane protein [Mobiluncus curtisii ATCC 51333]
MPGKSRKPVPAPLIFFTEGFIQYLGAGVAVTLFALMGPLTVAWLRTVFAAVLMLVWRRPWGARALTPGGYVWSCLFGTALVCMNMTFYEAIARLPLGTTVFVEFLGPVIFAAIGIAGWMGKLSVLLAFSGVVMIGGLGLDMSNPTERVGLIWALVAGSMWVAYMALGRKVAVLGRGIDSLAVALAFGSCLQLPLAWSDIHIAFSSWSVFGLALLMSMCSSFVPYILELVVLRDVSAAIFALLSALLPVTSLLVGVIMLRQIPSWPEVVGLILVSIAVAMTYRRDPADPATPADSVVPADSVSPVPVASAD